MSFLKGYPSRLSFSSEDKSADSFHSPQKNSYSHSSHGLVSSPSISSSSSSIGTPNEQIKSTNTPKSPSVSPKRKKARIESASDSDRHTEELEYNLHRLQHQLQLLQSPMVSVHDKRTLEGFQFHSRCPSFFSSHLKVLISHLLTLDASITLR